MPKAQKQPSKRIIPLSVPLSPTCIKPDPDADAATPLPTVKLPSTAAASSSRHVRQDLFSTPGPSSPSLDAAALKPYKCPYTGRCLDEKDGGVVIKSSDGYTFRCQSFDLMSASRFFRDYLNGREQALITLAERSEVVYAFLHMALLRTYDMAPLETKQRSAVQDEYSRIRKVIKMCDKYNATRLHVLLQVPSIRLASVYPYRFFKMANERGWVDVAKQSIKRFGCIRMVDHPTGEGNALTFGPIEDLMDDHMECEWDTTQLSYDSVRDLGLEVYHALARAMGYATREAELAAKTPTWADVARFFVCPQLDPVNT